MMRRSQRYRPIRFVWGFALLMWRLAVLAVEALLWCIFGARQLSTWAHDARRGYRSLSGGFHCPAGHPIATDDVALRCDACGFTYRGSIWRCPNPECRLPSSFVDCPTCGRSVRNPYRLGSP